jgi:AAHS family 3-hydroxyphenylpropionic acid transporter
MTRAPPKAAGVAITIAICFAVAVLEGYDIQAMGVAAPKLAPALGLARDQMGIIFSISSIGIVFGAAVGGWLTDRVGRKPVFITAVVAFGAFTLATGLSNDFATLFAARILTGLGLGAAMPSIMAISAEISSPNRRAFTATMMFVGMPLGGAASALLVANLGPDADWRTIFWLGGALPIVIAPLILFFMRETYTRARRADPKSDKKPSVAAQFGKQNALVVLAAFIPTYLVTYAVLYVVASNPLVAIAPAPLAAVALLPALLLHAALVLNADALFGDKRAAPTLLIWIALLPTLLILYLILNWLPTLVEAKGFTRPLAFELGGFNVNINAPMAFNLGSVVGALIIARIADAVGFRWPLTLSYAALIGVLIAAAAATSLPLILILSAAIGCFLMAANYSLYGIGASFYPDAVRGTGSGAASGAGRIGSIIGPLAASSLLTAGATASDVLSAMVPVAAVAGIAVFALSFFKRRT